MTSAPESGKANAAVCKVIAEGLGVPKSAVTVARGATSRHKIVDVLGADDAGVELVFGSPEADRSAPTDG